jgi:peroxiredoxin
MMKILKILAIIALMAASATAFAKNKAEIGKMAPNFTLTDSKGETHNLSDFKGKYIVLEWINFDCPFVVKHYDSKNMQKLQKKMTGKDVVWLTICSSADGKQGHFGNDEINKRIKELGGNMTAYLVDESGEVGRMYGAKTTPHMYIINPDMNLIYQGAIDDKPSTNQADIKGAKNYVEAALMEAWDGKEVSESSTKPYGCSVKYTSK